MKAKVVYNGRTIEVPDFHAKRLIAAGRATLPGQGTYMRRDMQAAQPQREPVSVDAADAAEPEAQSAPVESVPEASKATKRAAKKASKRTSRRSSEKGEGS